MTSKWPLLSILYTYYHPSLNCLKNPHKNPLREISCIVPHFTDECHKVKERKHSFLGVSPQCENMQHSELQRAREISKQQAVRTPEERMATVFLKILVKTNKKKNTLMVKWSLVNICYLMRCLI